MKQYMLNRKIHIKYLDDVKVDNVVPHTLISAGSGHGKDMLGERLITEKIGKYKVIDFYSDSREEGFFYGLPNDNKKYIESLATFSKNKLQARGFDSDIYMILGKRLFLFSQLPKNVHVVTLDEQDFKGEPVIDFLAGNSNPSREMLTMMFWVLRERYRIREPTLSDVEAEIERIRQEQEKPKKDQFYITKNYQNIHYMTLGSIFRNIIKIRESGIFTTDDRFQKISIKKILENPNIITTFSMQLLENDMQKALALGMIAKKIVDFKMQFKELPQVLVYMREIQKFYQKRDDNMDIHFSLLKNQIYYMLTEGRDTGIILYANAQDFEAQLSAINPYFHQLIIGRQSKKTADKLNNWAYIPRQILDKVPTLEPGVFLIISMGKFYYPVFSPPTMHKKKEAGFRVLEHLTKKYGMKVWDTTDLFIDELDEEE